MNRDSKGRFCKKNDMEVNMKKSNTEMRMEILANKGIDTSKFFQLTLSNIPVGIPVEFNVGGIKYNITPCVVDERFKNDFMNIEENEEDEIVKEIVHNGYVFNSKTDGRFVTAQTFRMLNTLFTDPKTGEQKSNWNLYLKNYYGYMYQFSMMKDELKRLSKMEQRNDPDFERLSKFFTEQVVVTTCKDYMKKLIKHVNTLPRYNCNKYKKGQKYVKLGGLYGNVFVEDLYKTIYNNLNALIAYMKLSDSYCGLYSLYTEFYNKMVELPYDTPKCNVWKDAFKGKGAYVTLLNIIKFHDVCLYFGNEGSEYKLDTYESVKTVEGCLVAYKGEYWKFHMLLVKAIKDNNFDLNKSIEKHYNYR